MRKVYFNSPLVQELFGIKIKLVGKEKKINKEKEVFLPTICKLSLLQEAVSNSL